MVKLTGAVVVCAVAAFAVAFYAAGAAQTTTKHVQTHATAVPFADAAAGPVAGSFSGQPAGLKLPPPRHIKHHSKPAASVTTVTLPPTTTASAPAAPVYTPPPTPKHKSPRGGTGTGTTVVGP